VTAADPGRDLLDKIDAREQALTREAGQTQTRIDELTAKLRELSEEIENLQITRKTLISLAGQDGSQPAAEPAGPSPALPDHPAYQQILTENIRSKLKRLVSRGILLETAPGLFAQPHPYPDPQTSSQDALPNPADENDINSRTVL
jgi:hypothetical protein